MKVAVLFNRLGPYHWARLTAAAQTMPVAAIELSADTKVADTWENVGGPACFARVTLFPEGDWRDVPVDELVKRLETALDQQRPAALAISGWSGNAAVAALRWSVRRGVPVIMMSESTAVDDRRVAWKEWIKRCVLRLCQTGLVGGRRHADYLAALGVPRERIFVGYDVVDNEYFSTEADRARQHAPKPDLPERFFLASARFIPQKNLPGLLDAYAQYRERVAAAWDLVLLGDGPLKPNLCAQIAALKLQAHVHLPGFRQYRELPVYYAWAGAFVHASTVEPWGLVVNEAMAAGLPVLVSNRCGCAPDLVEEGRNGFSFDPGDVDELARLMARVSSGELDLPAMGQASREIIRRWGPEAFAANLQRAAETAVAARRPRAGVIERAVLWGLIHQ